MNDHNRTRSLHLQDPDNPTPPSIRMAITIKTPPPSPRRARTVAIKSPFSLAYDAAYDAAAITSELLWAGIGNPYSEQEQEKAWEVLRGL